MIGVHEKANLFHKIVELFLRQGADNRRYVPKLAVSQRGSVENIHVKLYFQPNRRGVDQDVIRLQRKFMLMVDRVDQFLADRVEFIVGAVGQRLENLLRFESGVVGNAFVKNTLATKQHVQQFQALGICRVLPCSHKFKVTLAKPPVVEIAPMVSARMKKKESTLQHCRRTSDGMMPIDFAEHDVPRKNHQLSRRPAFAGDGQPISGFVDTKAADQPAGIKILAIGNTREKGSSSSSIETLFRILSVLGLEEDFLALARDDELGRRLEDAKLASPRKRAPKRKTKTKKSKSAKKNPDKP